MGIATFVLEMLSFRKTVSLTRVRPDATAFFLILAFVAPVWGGELYFCENSGGTGNEDIVKCNTDGTGFEVVVDWNEALAVLVAAFPEATDYDAINCGQVAADSFSKRIYWSARVFTDQQFIPVLMTANLNGRFISVVLSGEPGQTFASINVVHSGENTPAVGSWGVAIILLLLLSAGTVLLGAYPKTVSYADR